MGSDAVQSVGGDVQVHTASKETPRFVHASLPACLFVSVALILLYVSLRVGRYLDSMILTGVVKRFRKRNMEMNELGSSEPVSCPADSPCPTVPDAPKKSIPVPPPPSGDATSEAESRHEPSLPEQPRIAPADQAKDINNPAKVAWGNFVSAFRKRDTHEPFPSIEVANAISVADVDALLEEDGLGIGNLLSDCRNPVKRREIARKFLASFPEPSSQWASASILMTADEDTSYWVVGDIHAKVSAIAKICAVVAGRHAKGETRKRNVLILLGDYVDRGNEPLETLAFIESLKLKPLFDGFEVITLKGNHDVGLSRDADGKYMSMVSPAETAEFLQECADDGLDVSVEADAAIRLAAVSPRMCELTGIDPADPNRTALLVHGGVPHVDLQEKLYEVRNRIPQKEPFFEAIAGDCVSEDLRRGCAEDFTWIRFSKDLPVKQPNRGSRGCEIGTEDVSQYIFLHRALTTRDITFIFRGHDHERPGFACYSPHPELNPTKKRFAQRECNVLTLNAMEPDCSSNGMFRERDLALAELTVGNPVRLHRISTHHLEAPRPVSTPPKAIEPPPQERPDRNIPPAVQPEELLQMQPAEPPVDQPSPEEAKMEEQ